MIIKVHHYFMIGDAEIRKAVQIGERNKHVLNLAKNWCAHIEVERWGGTGLVEIETGLPIGARHFKCKHASAAGIAGMDLEVVALDFYDRNCSGCKQRIPVRIPNISELVAERDAAKQRATAAQALAAESTSKALASRQTRRNELSKGCDPARAGIFECLDSFDSDPSEQNRRILVQMATVVPEHFDSVVQESVYEIAEAGGFGLTEGALEVLGSVASNRKRLCEAALRAMARHDGFSVAGTIIAKYLHKDHAPLVPAAVPTMMSLSKPVRGFFGGAASTGDPKPLLAAYRLFPGAVLEGIRNHLRSPDTYARILANNAICLIAGVDNKLGLSVAQDLIRSLDLPDDHYGEDGSAGDAFANTLAKVMVTHPDEIDALIQAGMPNASEEIRSILFKVYDRVLAGRNRFNEEQTLEVGRAEELSFQRFVDSVVNRVETELLLKAIWFFRDRALDFPDLLENHAETLLGAAALLASDLETPQSPLLDLSLKPDVLKQMEGQARRGMLDSALDAILKPIGILAAQKPESLGKLVLTTFQALGDGHDYFKASLVKCLGFVAASPAGLTLAIPALYQATTSQSTMVRSASAQAYSQLGQHDPDDLPDLVHEGFLLLLTDPYVIVHVTALDALRNVTLPSRFTQRVIYGLAVLIHSYRNSRSNDDILAACLERMLELLDNPGDRFRQNVVSIVGNMQASNSARFIVHNRRALRGTAGLGKLLLNVLRDEGTDSYVVADAVSELRHVNPDEVLSISDEFRGAAKASESRGQDMTDEFVEILTAAGAWGVAADIARGRTSRLSDTLWDRSRKLLSEARQVAAELEDASARGDVESMRELALRWKKIEVEMRKDNEEHKKNRDPLFGISLPDQSE